MNKICTCKDGLFNLSVISFHNVSKEYLLGEVKVTALKEITLEIEPGKFVILLGPSGSGKTTLLNLIGGIDAPTHGKTIIGGIDISNYSRKQLAKYRRNQIGYIFQFFNLLPTLTALENIEFALDLVGVSSPSSSGRSFQKPIIRQEAMKWLENVRLGKRANHFPSQLSGGEQQRVAIARALAKDPPIIIADEPTGNLDFQSVISVLKLMKDLNKTTKKTFILATHNRQISKIADIVMVAHMGQISIYEQKSPLEDIDTLVW